MSLDGLRDAISREKRNEITNSELTRKRKLRELYAVTSILNAAPPLLPHDWIFNADPNDEELHFLDENDITKGRPFKDATLFQPFQNANLSPILQLVSSPKGGTPLLPSLSSPPAAYGEVLGLEAQLQAASASPSIPNPPLLRKETPTPADALSHVQSASNSSPRSATVSHAKSAPQSPVPGDVALVEAATEEPRAKRRKLAEEEVLARVEPDGPSVDPKDALPVTSDDIAALPTSAIPAVKSEQTPRPQVVHLPPKEVQEQRLRETERNLDKVAEKDRKEDERLNIPPTAAELASSPSSTIGPYSTTTPHPQHHSPDTSPDEEVFRDGLPQDTEPILQDSVAQAAKDDHDRILQMQMKAARESARALSPETPDAQLQLEGEQAIREARDLHGNSAGRLSEAMPSENVHSLTEHAEDIARNAQEDEHAQAPVLQSAADESLPTPSTTAPEPFSGSFPAEHISTKSRAPHPTPPDQPTPPVEPESRDSSLTAGQVEASEPVPIQSERRMTRVASGAIRQKSVSEILGDIPEPNATLTPKSSRQSVPETPIRRSSREAKEKSKISTVVFAKQDNDRSSKTLKLFNEDYAALQGASQDSSKDYLQGLFQYQAHHPPRSTPLQELLASARKTVTTTATLATLRESQDYKILKRVYQLQNANRWSLRQLEKSAEPPAPITHQDHLLAEMKWMQTDFKEERKWKQSLAATLAQWCADYVHSGTEDQASLRVKVRPPKYISTGEDNEMLDASTPDLIPSGAHETESESVDDEDFVPQFNITGAPAGLFSLGYDDVVMKIDRTPASDALLQELPYYEPAVESFSDQAFSSFSDPPLLPVSKYVTGKLISRTTSPPRKRSRYDYESEDEPVPPPSRSGLTSTEHSMPSTPGRRFNRNDLPPEMTDVALFNQENKHVRDRLQAAHHFRPPSEFLMPSVSFFESRNSSQWLWDEDQKLRTLVKEYTFNWSLISQELSQPSAFTSSAERRTPWECFERWVQLEGLPSEMSKTQYFRTYQSRLEQAHRTITNQHQAMQQQLQQQNMAGGQIPSQFRRRTTQPIRVERRRNNRYLAVIDGMRKLARKRESAAHKQAESQKAAALRKAHEPAPPKSNVHSPQEFSRLKWEREEKIREKSEQYRINMQRQAAAAAAAQRQQGAQPGAVPNGVGQPQRNGTPSNGAQAPTPMTNSNSQSGHAPAAGMQQRTHSGQPAMQANFPNANMAGMAMAVSGVPQAQMQANMQNQQRMPPPENMRLAMQRGQYPATNQHQFQLQQQQISMASNLASQMGNGNAMPNANMMASMAGQNMNGNGTPSMNGMSNSAGSPRISQVNPALQASMRGNTGGVAPTTAIHQFQNQVRNAHPDWPPDQVNKMATAEMNKWFARSRAMSAAAGTGSMGTNQVGSNVYLPNNGMGGGSPSPNSQNAYHQQLQQRMMSQQRTQQPTAGSPLMGNQGRPPSRSATPQNPQQMQQSPGMQQAQLARN